MVLANIRSQLLTLETIRPWEKNADNYSSACANGAFVLMERKFASPDERLALADRARKADAGAASPRPASNLKNPPRIFTEIAIEQLPGIISFFRARCARWPLPMPKIRRSRQSLRRSNAAVIAALEELSRLAEDRPACRARMATSASALQTFSEKLKYDEMVDIPLDRLLEIGWADLRKNQEHFKQVANELEPDKDARAPCSRNWAKTIPRRISCSTRSAPPSTA